MAKITIQNLVKQYDKKTIAVKDLSLEIQDKELMVLLGPSGCGKTTTLNCIAGLETPTTGKILFDDMNVTEVAPHQRNVAMVFQSCLLYPHLTGRGNITMSLHKRKLSKEEIAKRVEDAASLVNIQHMIDKIPAQLSGGERQRIAIAKAIVRDPSVFLMDEPLSNLDAALREMLRAEISVLQKRVETTMLLVTHDQIEAMTMGDKIAVMSAGELQQVGTPDEVYNRPANIFVGKFIGSPPMHLLTGNIKKEGNRLMFVNKGFTITLPAKKYSDALYRLQGKTNAILGVRSHHMSISAADKKPNSIRAQVYAVEHMGKENNIIVIDEHDNKIKIATTPQNPFQRDDMVWVAVDPENIHLFNEETGQNLCL